MVIINTWPWFMLESAHETLDFLLDAEEQLKPTTE